jgi:hypothetical protein
LTVFSPIFPKSLYQHQLDVPGNQVCLYLTIFP